MLLLGYSVEMYLKAGLARAYHGCREEVFDKDARRRFGHKLSALAGEIDYPLTTNSVADFDTLQQHILAGARYPAAPETGQSYADAVNDLTNAIWDRASFRRYCKLAAAIRKHVTKIDMDSNNPAIFKSLNIDQDGYLSFRLGGNLRTRITYRPSTDMYEAGKTAPNDVRALLDPTAHTVLLHYWDSARIVEDTLGRGRAATALRQDAKGVAVWDCPTTRN
ncbi:MAG: hypothetical protein H0W74_05930 [Sphingosinicella sp.]|nr:hypothetical protein [Sphingosinicella sp.]